MSQLCLRPATNISVNSLSSIFSTLLRHYGSLRSSECPGKAKKIMNTKCKVALITGGAEGIGFAAAHQLLRNNAKGVVLVGLDYNAGQQAVTILNCTYGKRKAMFIRAKVHDLQQLKGAFKKGIKQYKNIDIVINSAGVFHEEVGKCSRVNIEGTIKGTLTGIRYLGKKTPGKQGIIINICGLAGLEPLIGAPLHTGCSAGIIGFSRSIGDKYHQRRTGIRIVALCVGVTKTFFFKDATKKCLNEYYGNKLRQELRKSKRQHADVCGKSIVEIIKYGKSGKVFVSNSSNLYLLDMPKWKSYSVLVSQFI